MIYFIQQLCDEAIKLIDLKSTIDDLKAAKDLAEINSVFTKEHPSDIQCTYEIKLHKRINTDYPEIEKIDEAATKVASAIGIKKQTAYTLFENVKQDLLRDAYGIYASVLLKHGKIKTVEDFIEKID